MRLLGMTAGCALLVIAGGYLWAQQLPSAPQPQPNAGQQSTSSPPDSRSPKQTTTDPHDHTDQPNGEKKEPSRLPDNESEQVQSSAPRNQPIPRSGTAPGQSSSKDTQIDLSPPPDDMLHEGADVTGVTEFHAYDPHKAAKDVEVGDYYYRRKNYKAAESRYAEALDWKPNDAIATFKLAQTQEKLGMKTDALKNYEAYLKILPQGEFAGEAKTGIDRLKK